MLSNHLGLLAASFKLTDIYKCMNVHWNKRHHLLTSGCSIENQRIQRNIRLYFIVLGFFAGTNHYFAGHATFLQKFLLAFEVIALTGLLIHMEALRSHAGELCLYVNGLLKFPNNNSFGSQTSFKKLSILDKLNIVFAYILPPMTMLLPICFVYGLHLLNPCKASLLGYWMLPECQSCGGRTVFGRIIKSVVIVCNHALWMKISSIVPADLGGLIILGSLAFRSNLKM